MKMGGDDSGIRLSSGSGSECQYKFGDKLNFHFSFHFLSHYLHVESKQYRERRKIMEKRKMREGR